MIPSAYEYAPVLMPYALGNFLTASSLYLASDVWAKGPRLLSKKFLGFPAFGPGLGVVMAFTAPFTYPFTYSLVHNEGLDRFSYDEDLVNYAKSGLASIIDFPPLAQVIAGTGFISGLLLQGILEPLVIGLKGIPWTKFSGRVLGAGSVATVWLYTSTLRALTEMRYPHLRDSEDPMTVTKER